MNKALSKNAISYCSSEKYAYISVWKNPPISGVLFLSKNHVKLRDVIDARKEQHPFFIARAKRKRKPEITVIVLPLRRPVPNMILAGNKKSLLPSLGIALKKNQRLSLEGHFNSRFFLYCPKNYERDALYIFTPDVMAEMIDILDISDIEFVDDRLLLYAKTSTIYNPANLQKIKQIVKSLHNKLERQTKFYNDHERSKNTAKDPFRVSQLTTAGAGKYTVGNSGRRVKTRTTLLQKIGILIVGLAALAAGTYWVLMIYNSFTI